MIRIINADVIDGLKQLPDQSVHCVVTSPPYWGLRDYGVEGQIGIEKTPEEYVSKMVQVFQEVKRVLRNDGTLWLNLGDCYSGSSGAQGGPSNISLPPRGVYQERSPIRSPPRGLKAKDLIGIPWRVALALQQPHEEVLIKDKSDRAWLAGIIDGEGCITSNEVITSIQKGRAVSPSYPIILQIRMSDREALERIVEITKVSKVQAEHLSPSQIGTLQRAPSCWKTSGNNAMRLLAECYPYLTVKKQQALLAWNLQFLKEGIETKRGVPIPKDNLKKREILYNLIRDANQRRKIELPPWIKTPEIKVELGWYLRSDCIWHKPNPMPSSVEDRPTTSHGYIFLLTKSAKYFYDGEAIREPASQSYIDDKRPVGVLRQKVNKKSKYPDEGQFKKQDLTGNPTYTGFNERWKGKHSN